MPKRLEKALELGADGVINAKEENVIEKAMELTGEEGFNLAYEYTVPYKRGTISNYKIIHFVFCDYNLHI